RGSRPPPRRPRASPRKGLGQIDISLLELPAQALELSLLVRITVWVGPQVSVAAQAAGQVCGRRLTDAKQATVEISRRHQPRITVERLGGDIAVRIPVEQHDL